MENMLQTENEYKTKLVTNSLNEAFTYDQYRKLVEENVSNGTSTGPLQTEALSNYTLLNHTRMKRLDKTVKISEAIQEKFKGFTGDHTWLVLTESWCGDAAHALPVMNKLALLAPAIDFRMVLRDEHLELMDAFLTQGSRSIPKLIVLDNKNGELVGEWGPRPSWATAIVNDFKTAHGKLSPEFKTELQVWYNKDKSSNILDDLAQLID
jgi:hypothetical protein